MSDRESGKGVTCSVRNIRWLLQQALAAFTAFNKLHFQHHCGLRLHAVQTTPLTGHHRRTSVMMPPGSRKQSCSVSFHFIGYKGNPRSHATFFTRRFLPRVHARLHPAAEVNRRTRRIVFVSCAEALPGRTVNEQER